MLALNVLIYHQIGGRTIDDVSERQVQPRSDEAPGYFDPEPVPRGFMMPKGLSRLAQQDRLNCCPNDPKIFRTPHSPIPDDFDVLHQNTRAGALMSGQVERRTRMTVFPMFTAQTSDHRAATNCFGNLDRAIKGCWLFASAVVLCRQRRGDLAQDQRPDAYICVWRAREELTLA